MRADLQGACLSGAKVQRAELVRADLARVTADGADFTEAVLNSSSLAEADLRSANFTRADLERANLWNADLRAVQITEATVHYADLCKANLRGARIVKSALFAVNLTDASLFGASIKGSMMSEANLTGCDLREADIDGCDLSAATLIRTKVEGLAIRNCQIYCIRSELLGEPATQEKLNVASRSDPPIHVDDLTCGETVRLFSNNDNIVKLIDTLNTKGILVLGSFKQPCMGTLETVRSELLQRDRIPFLFDFPRPKARNWLETIEALAFLAQGVIVDYTEPRQVLCEIPIISRLSTSLPIQPIIAASDGVSYRHIKYHRAMFPRSILAPFTYEDTSHLCRHLDTLLQSLEEAVVDLAQ